LRPKVDLRAWIGSPTVTAEDLDFSASWPFPVEPPATLTAHVGEVSDPADLAADANPDRQIWHAAGVTVTTRPATPHADRGRDLDIAVHAGSQPIRGLTLRWPHHLDADTAVLGDAWERGYGDLCWQPLATDRLLPWYFVASATDRIVGIGVRVRPNAFCHWRFDDTSMVLHLDLRNGGDAAVLGDRTLAVATVTGAECPTGDSADDLTAALCARMCTDPLPVPGPIVGANNWYYAYGEGFDPDAVVGDAALVAEYVGDHPVRPFGVVDAGWSPGGGAPGGPWDRGTPGLFDDMPGLAARVRDVGARPGIWMRPVARSYDVDERLLRPGPRPRGGGSHPPTLPLDISRPEVLELVRTDVARIAGWGFELIKHDFSTFDVFGRFGPAMGTDLTDPGWHFADRSRTNAELINALYQVIVDGARSGPNGGALVLGCNTVGHLAAGRVHLNRTGDDTSGRDWARTKQMGVNTLAYRMPQHGRFFVADADCVPATAATPWAKNRQFADAIARSGTALFVSVDPAVRTRQIDDDLRAAFRLACDGGVPGGVRAVTGDELPSPLAPTRWVGADGEKTYDW
jgi:alpha-galactosidase